MFSKRVERLNPYVPGEQPKDRGYIKLNANENPYPPSSKAIEDISIFVKNNAMKLALYPDPDSSEKHSYTESSAQAHPEDTGTSSCLRISS
mgnify:CR=1 FL=1